MGKVKQKLLIVFLIVIAIVIGYQAYVIGHGYARTASNVPFMSGGVMIYCREHHNSFNYGDGTRGYAYACVGEVNLKNKNAHDFAYYVSRGGTNVQRYLWDHSGESQGAIILNAGSSFSGWFDDFDNFNPQGLFSEGAGNDSGTSEANYNNTNTEKSVTLEDMRTDFSLKPVESMPEYFFKNIYANPETQETTGTVEGDDDIKEDFVSQLYNDFLEETKTTINSTWGSKYEVFEEKVKNKYADLIKKEYEEEEKAKGREKIPQSEIDSIKIDYTQIDAETKQKLINEMLKGTPYKHKDGNIDKIQEFLSKNYSDDTKKKAKEDLLNDLNNLNITNDLEVNEYDDETTKKTKQTNRQNFENHITAALTASDIKNGNASNIVNQIIREEKAIEMIEATINEISAKEKQGADSTIDQYITALYNKFKNVGNNDTLQTDKQALKNAKLKLEYTILLEQKLDVEKANLQQQAGNDVGKQAELKRVEEKIKRRDNIKKTLGEEALKNNYNYSLFYEDVVDHIQNALIQILAKENMTAEEISFLAEDVAYRIVEETIEDIEAEEEGLITDISYEEYKFLFELAKLYNHFDNINKQQPGIVERLAQGDTATIQSILKHVNTYWDDGHGAELRKVDVSIGNTYNVKINTSLVYSDVDSLLGAEGKNGGTYTNVNGEEIVYVEANGKKYWGYADEVEMFSNGIRPKAGKHGAIYYEDNDEAVVSFFDKTLCLSDEGGESISTTDEIRILEEYAKAYVDKDGKGTADLISVLNGTNGICKNTRTFPNLAKLLESAQGTHPSNKINYLYSVYSNDIKNICKNSTSGSGSIDQYYVFNHDSNSPLDYKWTGTVERASQIFQWLMQKNSDGVTNIEGIANRFRVDDSKAKFLIDAENGKYLIGPYTMEYASIRLNNEQILGINGFSVNIQVMDKDGKLHTEKLTEGIGKNQYKIVRSATQRVQTDKNGIVSLPKSGSEFYIELDKDIKTELGKSGNYSFSADDIRLTENDKFSFSVSYKYLAGINAIVHFLRDCSRKISDAAYPTSPDSQWDSGHPQRLIAITYGDEWKHTTASTEVNPVSYDFKLRKIKKLTDEEINTQKEILKMKSSSEEEKAKIDAMSHDQIIQEILNNKSGLSGVNGAEFVAAAKYKANDGSETYFDLETQTKDLGSDFNQIVEKAKSGEIRTYLSASQAEGNGWILWNNIQDTITVNNKIYTLQKVEAKETKAPNGYKIAEDKVITIEKYGSRVVCAENEESTPPYTVTVRKVDEKGDPIEGLNLEGWFVNLGVVNGIIQTTNYGYYDRQKVTTNKDGIATFETDMYSDSVMFLIVEKPDKAYDYQYFKLVRVVFSAKLNDGKVEKDFRSKSADKPFLDTFDEINNGVDFENGVYSVTDKNGVKHLGKEGKANDYVKTQSQIENNEANVDVQIVNKRRKPYSLEINKLDEFGKTSEYLAGTTFNFWISKDGSDLRSGQIVIGKDGKGKIDKLDVYGNNLFLYLQEVKTQTGFKTKLNNKTIVLKYSASEDGDVKIESIENKEMLSGRELNKEPIKLESTGADDDKTVSIKIDVQNGSDKYYLKFRKVNRNGEPLKNATFTLTDKAPATAGSSLANSQTVTSDENGYMEFVGPEETENGKVKLYLYEVSAPAGYEVKSDTSIDNPIEISYTYKAGYTTLKDLKIMYNGEDITKDLKEGLQCETKKVTTEEGTEQIVANLKNNNQYVFNFGDLNEIFKLVNYEDTYNLTFKKEDTKGNALGNTKFNVSIIKIEKGKNAEEVLGKILNNEAGVTGMDRLGAIGAMFATYEEQPSTYDRATKKYKDPVYQELKDKEISTSHNEGDAFENGTAVVEKIATYGDLYAVIKETESDSTHQKIDDIIIAHYTMNPGDTEPTWGNDIYVAKKGEDGQYQITKYTKQASATGYTNAQGNVYEFAKYSESKLIVENQELPYSLKFSKVNGLSGKPVKDVNFTAKMYHLYKNDIPDTRTGKTGENGIFNISNIFKYSEDDSDIIQLELHETVPQGYRYYSQYQELIYIIDYVKKGPESALEQQSVQVIGCRRDNGETVNLTNENGNTVNLDTNIATNNTQSGEGENQNAEQSKSYVHNVTVKNMPTYNLDGLLKVEEIDRKLETVTDVTFTGKIRKDGVSSQGEVVQEGQAYVVDGTKLDLSKFTIRVDENGKIVASGIDTCDDFVNDDGSLKTDEKTYTLVLTEQKSGKYKPLKHDIEVEYSCKYNQDDDKWEITYKKVKYGETTSEIKTNTSETPNYTALIDTEELGFYQNGDALYVVNKPEITPAQILLQKKDEKGKLVDGITFKGKVEQINTIDGETPNVVDFSQDGVTTGEAKSADGKNLTGVAAIPNIDFGGDIKITINSEEWKDKNKQDPLDFPEGKVEITGVKIAEKWEGNIGYRVVTVPTGILTVTTYSKDGTKKADETINIKDKSTSSNASFDVSFSEDSNVVTFYITNHNKRYNLDGSGDDGSTAIPFPYKIEKDILGNEQYIKEGILFTGRIEDSNGNILQDPVEVKFTEYVQSSGNTADGNMGIGAFDIDGAISSKPDEPKEVYNLIIKEKDQSAINSDAITVRYTCVYDSSANNGEGKFTSEIKGYEYKNVEYNFDKNMQEAKDNIIPGKVDSNGGLININDLYVPIRKSDEYGNLINGVVFEGKIKVHIEKDENGHPKNPTLKEEHEFKTVTGGQYYNPETKQMETAPDGVAVIPIPKEVIGKFDIILESEYWGTIKDGVWTTDKGSLPDGYAYDLEFKDELKETLSGYEIKEEANGEGEDKTVDRVIYYNETKVEYNLKDEASTPTIDINKEDYKFVTVDKKGNIEFVNDELRYDLKKSTEPGKGDNIFDNKYIVDVTGYKTKIKDGIYFTGYITDEVQYGDNGEIIKPNTLLQQGKSTKDGDDKDKFTVGFDETGAIVATGIKGRYAGFGEEKTFKLVLEELSSNGENGGYNLEPIDPIVVTYTCKYDKESRTFETKIKSYEYHEKVYELKDDETIDANKDLIPGLVELEKDNEGRSFKTALENTPKSIDIPLIKKDKAGNLINGVKFTGKIIALDEEYKDENGKPVFENTNENSENGQPATKRKSMTFEVVTGETPKVGCVKDGNSNDTTTQGTSTEEFKDVNGNPIYSARDGVALIPQIPYTGNVKLIIEKEEWTNDENKPAPGQPDLEFIDDRIEIDFAIEKDQAGEKHIKQGGMSIKVMGTDENGNETDVTSNYMDPKNNQHNILVGINYLDKDKKSFAFGIGINNDFKTYDVPIALKVIKEDEKDTENEEANTVNVNGQTYRQPTAEEAKEIKFRAEVCDSNGTVVQTLLPLDPDDMGKANAVGIGIEVKDIDNDGKQEAVIVAKGIKGSITGADIVIKLHEEYSGGLEPIPDIEVHYKNENNAVEVTKYQCDSKIEQCTANHDNNGTCKIDDLIYVNDEGKYALVNEETPPPPPPGPETVSPELTIKKVININGKENNGAENDDEAINGHEVGVPGIYFKIRVCTEECKNDCKNLDKCSCDENTEKCEKCFDYEAISGKGGITTFKLKDIIKDTENGTDSNVKVIILEERLATEEDKAKIEKAENGESSSSESEEEVEPYTTEQPGDVKFEFIKNPIVIEGVKIKKADSTSEEEREEEEEEEKTVTYKVDYTDAKVAENDTEGKEHVRIDSEVGAEIVFTNKEEKYDLKLFDKKLVNNDGTLTQIFNGVEFEADIVKVEDNKEISTDNLDEETILQHFVSETDKDIADNAGDNGDLGTVGIDENTGEIKLKGVKGTIVSKEEQQEGQEAQATDDNGKSAQYAVILRETSSEVSDASSMPAMVIIYECKCTKGENENNKYETTIKEYRWKDKDSEGNEKWHYLNPTQDIQKGENGETEKEFLVDGKIRVLENGNEVELINDRGTGNGPGGGGVTPPPPPPSNPYPAIDRIGINKIDNNGNPVAGVNFKGKLIAVDDNGNAKQKAVIGEDGKITGWEDIQYDFDMTTNDVGLCWIPAVENEEIPYYEGKFKIVITEEKWADSVTEIPYKLGFADEIIEISGLAYKTDTYGLTHIDYPETLEVKSYKKGTDGSNGEETNTYQNKVDLVNKGSISFSIENEILDYDLDLFDAKLLKYGEHYEQIKDNVTFTGKIIGYKTQENTTDRKYDIDYNVDVELISADDSTGQQGTADGKVGKIVAKGIDGEITGNGIYLEITETSINYPAEKTTIIVKYDYNPDKNGNGTPTIKEYRKWKDGVKGEAKGSVAEGTTDLICTAESDDAKALIGGMIYKNYSNTAKNSLVNIVTPNPLDIQIKKVDSNGKPVKGIKFTGRIIAVDDSGNTKKDENGQEITKEFSSVGAIGKELNWITSDGFGKATLHLTSEEVDRFAGKIKIEIDKEEWSRIDDDRFDPDAVKPTECKPLDFIDGKIEITGKKIDVQKDKTSRLINDGTPQVKITKDNQDVTSNYKDRVNANVSNKIAISMKNIIKEYDLTLFDKKIIRVNGEEIKIKEGVVFTGEITHENKVYPIDVEFNTGGEIVARGIRGDITGKNITLKVTEVQTIDGIVPVDFDIVYNCSYNNGQFVTEITKKTLKEHGTGKELKEISATDESGNVLEEDVIINDGITLKIRKVDENGNTVEGIKFTGKVKSRENTGNGGEKSFTASTTDGIATITLTKDDITNYIELGKFDVIIEKEEWNDATAKANWQGENKNRELNLITSPITISGYTLFETWDGNNAHRSVDFSDVSCDNGNVTIEKELTTIRFKNNDLVYNIPFIKTNKLLTKGVENLENLKDVAFEITVKNGEGDNNPQCFSRVSDENGRFDIVGVTKFGDSSGVVTLILKEQVSPNATAKLLEDEMVITYKPVISSDNKVQLTDIKVDGTPISELTNIQENENGEEQETKETNIQYVEIKQNEETVTAFNLVNPDRYKITIDKDLKVGGNVIDATEPVKFKGIITTNPSQVNGNDTIMSYKSFEESLKTWKDTEDTIVFDGVTKNGKLEIPKDIVFYNKQVYVYFIEYDVPDTMASIEKVMWASFNKKESSVQSTSTSDDYVIIDNKDPLNISVKVVNEAKPYKLNFKKVDAQDASRQINYQGAKFTLQLKEIANENGISKTKIVDTMTVEFDNTGKIKPQAQLGQYLVDATFVNNAIYVDVNKFGNLQLVITEETAPTGYQKLDTDIVINYTANAQTSDRKEIITNVQVPDDIDSSIKDKINAKANPNGDDVSLEFTIPNSPNEYSVTIKKVSRTNPSNVLNNIHFQLLFYNNNKERLTEVEKSLYNVEKGTVTIDGLKTYGTNYMVLHETETDGKTVRLEGYHVFEMTAVVGKKATFKYLGMFKSDDMADLTIDEINEAFKNQDLGKLNKDMESYFKTDEDSVGVGSLSVGNDEPKNYSINVLKVDEEKDPQTKDYKPLEGAEFDLYLTRTTQGKDGNYPDGDYQLEDNLLETKDRTQETAANGLISLTDLKQYSDQYGDLKLTLVESKTPKDYKSVFERIEIVYSTKDGNDITIKQIKVFGTDGKELGDYAKYVEISNANENEITNAEIDVIVKNIHKKPVSLSLSKIYYQEVNGKPTEKSIPGATFSGVVYEKGKPEDQTAFSATTDNSGNANLGEFYVEGDIEVVIEEISAPDGFEDIPKTTIECHVNANGGKSTIDTKNYSVSTNALASIEEKENMYNLKIIDTPIVETNIYLAGFVWEDRPTTLSIKEDADYTVKDENGNYIATEGLYDEGIDKLIVSKNLNGEITTERDDISSGILVSLHELTRKEDGTWYELGVNNIVKTVTTGDTGSYKFEDLDPFAKYYVTFEMKGTYNHENYENVRFLVKSVGTDGVVEQWNSISNALTEVKDGNSEQEEKARDIWRRNSKAVADGEQVDNGVNPNISTTTQTENPRGNKFNLTRYDNVQLYPAYDQFTLVDSEKHKNQNGTFADYVLYYNVNSSTQTVTKNTVEADYTMTANGENSKKLVFRALSPVHDYINFGIVERPKFDLRLEKDVDKLQVQINDKTITYKYGKKVDSGHMYTLEINEADIEKLGDMEITYKIDVTNQSTVDGYLNSIAEYYNADIMKFKSAYVESESNKLNIVRTTYSDDKDGTIKVPELIPEQYMLQGSEEVTRNPARTGQIILELDNEHKTIKAGNKISIYVTYTYNDIKQILGKEGKINNAGDSYVTLGLAEIYNSNSIGGRKDINSTNGNLTNKYISLYGKKFDEFYKNFGRDFYLQGLSHEKEGEKDIDDEDAAPALKILIADPNTRKIKGSVFDDLDKDGIKNDPDREDGANSDTSIQGMTVNLYNLPNGRIDEKVQVATTNTDEEGYYEFSGATIESGYYIVEFVYGDENTILTSLYEYKPNAYGNGLEEQVIKEKNAEWVDEERNVHYKRYNYTSYNGLEYESTTYIDSIDNIESNSRRNDEYWYKKNADKTYSDAKDIQSDDKENPTPGTREYADKTLNGQASAIDGNDYYMMDNVKAELLYSYRGKIEEEKVKEYIRKLRENKVNAETERFKINVMDTESDEYTYTYYDTTESGVTQYTDSKGNIVDSTGCEADIDFGVKPRAKTNLKVTKTVDNVKIYTSSGNSNVDASYEDGKVVGTAGRVQWTKQANGNRGYIWIQRSEEEIIGATLEITYRIDVVNEEVGAIEENQYVTIVDYVQDGMTYAEENNVGNNWTIQTATTDEANKVSSIGNVKINNNIDLKDVSTVVTQDVKLEKDEEGKIKAKPVYITLTKTLNSYSNTDIDAYTNYVEVILTITPGIAKLDENSIPGNFDPKLETTIEGNLGTIYDLKNKHRIIEEVPYDGIKAQSTSESIRLERDTAKALETISITAETGENRDTTYYVIAFGVIAVLATGIGVIIEKVIRRK